MIIVSVRGDGLQTGHPIVLSVLHEGPNLGGGLPFGVDLLYEREARVVVEPVSRQEEMFIEWASQRSAYVPAVSVVS